jgi:hypothetical protein
MPASPGVPDRPTARLDAVRTGTTETRGIRGAKETTEGTTERRGFRNAKVPQDWQYASTSQAVSPQHDATPPDPPSER